MRTLTEAELRSCVHPDETSRFILAMLFVGPGLLLSLLGLLAYWLGPFLLTELDSALTSLILRLAILAALVSVALLVVWLTTILVETKLRASAAEITHEALPELEGTIRKVCAALSYDRNGISAFLRQEARYASRWIPLWRDVLVVNSDLAETVYDYDAPGELEFSVATHVGAARARFLRTLLLARSAEYVAWVPVAGLLVLPWLRATRYTADQIALAATGDLQAALDALGATMVGKDLASMTALVGWIEQHRALRWSPASFLLRAGSYEPHPVDRVANLLCFARHAMPRRFDEIMQGLPTEHRRHVLAVLDASRHAR